MSFFRPLAQTAPNYNANLPWPIPGLAYVVMFGGIPTGGILVGLLVGQWYGALIGSTISVVFFFIHGWFFDQFIEKRLASLQPYSKTLLNRMVFGFAAFTWAVVVSAIPIFITLKAMYGLGAPSIGSWVGGKPSR